MGNEELLKHSFPEDIWFHVDKYSSAHIYLRLPSGSVDLANVKDKEVAKQKLRDALDSVPEDVIKEMCQLTKANSIEGCKLSAVDIVYTPFLNLKKEERMDTGQVGFKDESFRKLIRNVERNRDIEKRIEKTREERKIDLAKEREQRDEQERKARLKVKEEWKQKQKQIEKENAELAAEKACKDAAWNEAASQIVRVSEDDDFD